MTSTPQPDLSRNDSPGLSPAAGLAPESLLTADRVAATLADLVRIESVNPDYGGPAGGEARVIDHVAGLLRGIGLAPAIHEAMPGRPDLLARLPGRDRSRTILYFTHVDTVSVAGMSIPPFEPAIRDGRLWGRGSTDAKGQAAALLHALAAVVASGKAGGAAPACDILFGLTCDEESGFGGVKALAAMGLDLAGAVVGEPTDLEVVVAHKGTQRRWVAFEGRAVHSSKPHLGVNAIHHAADFVKLVQEELAVEIARRSHPLLGSPTVSVSKIEGGTQVNLVPGHCRVLIDRRTLPGETRASVEAEFESLLERTRARHPESPARHEPPYMVDPPLETAPDAPLALAALEVARRHGASGVAQGAPYGTDGSKLSAMGIPTIVVGPGSIDQAHTKDEFVALAHLEAGARFYYDLMRAERPW